MKRPTKCIVTFDAPISWAHAGPVGDAINAALGGTADVELDRKGCRWTFTRRGPAEPAIGFDGARTTEADR